MIGALVLATRAALLSGAGLVHGIGLSSKAPHLDLQYPEILMYATSSMKQLAYLNSIVARLNCIVIGPGLGQSDNALQLLTLCIEQNVALVIDGDALNLIAGNAHLIARIQARTAETIITPHPLEAARLLKCKTKVIQTNRIAAALKLAKIFHATCILKGAGSICARHDGIWYINTTGNAGLSAGGTGDVLAGILGGLIAQGMNGLQAAKLSIYAHGAAADALVDKEIGPIGMTASEVALEVRHILHSLNQTRQAKSALLEIDDY